MERELVVVLLSVSVTIWMVAAWSGHVRRGGYASPAVQAAGGLICGLVAAVAVAVPYVDVVPDEHESTAEIVVVVGLIGVAVVAAVRRRRSSVQRSRTEQTRHPRSPTTQDELMAQRAVVTRRASREPQ